MIQTTQAAEQPGGLGFAFRTFLHGKLEPGISIVLEEIGIENQIKMQTS